ncbi:MULTISPECIES: histidine kinase [unclassified Nonomuraea]|uniref:sensor histidine kinase n=1 Tax=unclassified Nonomuraea TaxID=2593643 RepID=UPI0033CE495A
MRVTTPPLLKRVPPGMWTALAWCAGMVFTFLARVRLPGEWLPAVRPGSLIYRWDGLTFLAVATALALCGGGLLGRRPLMALTLLLAAPVLACVPLGVGEIPLAQYLAVDVALYVIAATRPRRTGAAALAAALALLAGYLGTRLLFGWAVGTSAELAVAMTAVIAWLIGRSTHQAREHAAALTAQAAARAVTDERLRISRELHDIVAHSIGVIALQAGAARRVIDTQPERARQALGEIENVGRETLAGLRRMVGTLRRPQPDDPPQPSPHTRPSDDQPTPRPPARATAHGPHTPAQPRPRTPAQPTVNDPRAWAEPGPDTPHATPRTAPHASHAAVQTANRPMPGLADLERLAATTTDAGVRVEVHWLGERRSLPADLDVSAYRIVQEAVTNVVRHAGVHSCRVSVEYRPAELSIEVLDSGRRQDRERGRPEGKSWTEENRTKDRTEEDRTEEDRTGQGRTGQGRTGQGRTEQDQAADGRTEQNRVGVGWAREGHAARGHLGGDGLGGDGLGGGGLGGGGYGLAGMRERVDMLNGELSAGPRPEGGFRVAARLPIPAGAR